MLTDFDRQQLVYLNDVLAGLGLPTLSETEFAATRELARLACFEPHEERRRPC